MNPFDPPSRGDENPYAPPETDLRERHDRTLTAITGFEPVEPFSIDNVMRRSWRIYQKRLGITLAIVIGVWALNVGYQIFSSLLLLGLTGGDVHSPVSGPLQIVLGIAGYALSFFLTAGQAVALLRLARNRDASLGDVFGAGRYFWRMLGATLLIGLLMIPITFVCALPVLIGVAATSGVQEVGVRAVVIIGLSLIGIVGAFAITTRLFQYLYVLVDDDCGAFECIQRSVDLTRGHVGELFLISILAMLIGLSGILACGVGLIFTIPFASLVFPCAYVCLTGRGAAVMGDAKKPLRTDVEFIDFLP